MLNYEFPRRAAVVTNTREDQIRLFEFLDGCGCTWCSGDDLCGHFTERQDAYWSYAETNYYSIDSGKFVAHGSVEYYRQSKEIGRWYETYDQDFEFVSVDEFIAKVTGQFGMPTIALDVGGLL